MAEDLTRPRQTRQQGDARRGTSSITRRRFITRTAGLAALASLGVGGLAACGGGEERAAQSGPVTIEYWHVNDETFGLPTIRDLVREFNEANPGVTVRERFQPDSYVGLLENLQTAQAAGNTPDVAQIGYDFRNYVASNFEYVPAEELAQQYGPDDPFGGFQENLLDLGRVDGRQVGVPYVLSVPMFFYNPDLMSKAGLDPDELPQNWEEWERAAQTVRDELDMPTICFGMTEAGIYWTQAMVESNGGEMLVCQDGQAGAAFTSREAVEAMSFWSGLGEREMALYLLKDQAEQTFLAGEVPVLVYFSSAINSYQDQANFDVGGAIFPGFGGDDPQLPGGGNNLFVFSEDDAKREAAWKFVQFLTAPDGLGTWLDATGYLPTRADMEVEKDDPVFQVALDASRFVVPWFSFPGANGFQANQALHGAEEGIARGEDDAGEALDAAAEEVNGLIEGEPCP